VFSLLNSWPHLQWVVRLRFSAAAAVARLVVRLFRLWSIQPNISSRSSSLLIFATRIIDKLLMGDALIL
jgi:hypothetical protein